MVSQTILELKDRYSNQSGEKIGRDFIQPCLKECKKYRRGTGFFTSGAFKSYIGAIQHLINDDIKIEILCSPKINFQLYETLKNCHDEKDRDELIQKLVNNISKIAAGLEENPDNSDGISQLIAYLITTNKLEIKFARPLNFNAVPFFMDSEIDDEPDMNDVNDRAMYHIKYGYFQFDNDITVAFEGSVNESDTALSLNSEKAAVYRSWIKEDVERMNYVVVDLDNDWNGKNKDIKIYNIDTETLKMIKNHVQKDSNFKTLKTPRHKIVPIDIPEEDHEITADEYKYRHQAQAVEVFLKEKIGILEMATGTGKTRTALKIITKLFEMGEIDTFIVTCYGKDLLDQWRKVFFDPNDSTALKILDNFSIYKGAVERRNFSIDPRGAGLLTSIDDVANAIAELTEQQAKKTLIIYDEVHNLGTERRIDLISPYNSEITYRLGLSATPDKGEYNEKMTQAIKKQFGGKNSIFTFTTEQAIERGILCEFNYIALDYVLDEDDKKAFQRVFANEIARKKEGNPMPQEEKARRLANVYKLTKNKLLVFDQFLRGHPEILQSTIIFVQEEQYGSQVLKILHEYTNSYKTYYGGDDESFLKLFVRGEIDVLVTCNAISQGIDIPNLQNIVIFSSGKDNGETIQRLGRCLRNPPSAIKKTATVIDFFHISEENKTSFDERRVNWLKELSLAKFDKNA